MAKPKNGWMSPEEFRRRLDEIGISTITDAAKFFRVGIRTVRRWANGHKPISYITALLLRLMAKHKIKAEIPKE